ncbi:MAG: hypothetical protein AB2556_19625, partial [Candidatus Thiodiazotropha sp.]
CDYAVTKLRRARYREKLFQEEYSRLFAIVWETDQTGDEGADFEYNQLRLRDDNLSDPSVIDPNFHITSMDCFQYTHMTSKNFYLNKWGII